MKDIKLVLYVILVAQFASTILLAYLIGTKL
jgi:hypothetical protein